MYIKDLQNKVGMLTGKDTTLEELCLSLLELARIDVTLMEADESDRKSISLIGVRGQEINNSEGNNN